MTVANNYAPLRQLGNGSTTVFSGSWSMIAAAYAVVQLESVTTGVRTPVTQGPSSNQYQITITSSGFTVTFGTAPTSSYYVDISRKTGLDQTNSYTTSSGFQGQVEENSFDKLTASVQDAAYAASQAITIPTGESYTTVLPAAAQRASQYLAFDSFGNVTTVAGQASVPVSSAMAPVVDATTLSAARTAMAVAGLPDAVNFTNSVKLNGSPVFDKINVQKFTSSGTYTPSTGMVYAIVECWGAGGGGAGAAGVGTGSYGTGGGGAGSYSRKNLTSATIGASQTITIGAAGSGGSGNVSGSAGGQTSFGSLCVANGGSGGGASTGFAANGGVGGTAGTGDITGLGANGNPASGSNNATSPGMGGNGGSTLVGGGGIGSLATGSTLTAGGNATGYGAGGGGASDISVSSGSVFGGNGSPGIVIVTEFISA